MATNALELFADNLMAIDEIEQKREYFSIEKQGKIQFISDYAKRLTGSCKMKKLEVQALAAVNCQEGYESVIKIIESCDSIVTLDIDELDYKDDERLVE